MSFGNPSMATKSDALRCANTSDKNQPIATLGDPWTPLPNFQTWDSSKQTGSHFSTPAVLSSSSPLDVFTLDTVTTANTSETFTSPEGPPHVELESSPIPLRLRNTPNNLG